MLGWRSPPKRSLVAVVALAILLPACPRFQGQAGVFTSLADRPGRTGTMLSGYLSGGDDPEWGLGLGTRLKFARNLQHVGLSVDAQLHGYNETGFVPGIRAGINFFQFENVDQSFAYGMFTPYAEGGFYIELDEGSKLYLTIVGMAEYTVRFTSQADDFHWGAMLGLATLHDVD